MAITQCLQSKEQILIIGDHESKRTLYFSKVAEQLGYRVKCIDWQSVRESNLTPSLFIKIDPPQAIGIALEELNVFSKWYEKALKQLTNQELAYSNSPQAIYETLDKVLCKKRLEEKGIATTPMIDLEVNSYEALKQQLIEKKIRNVFIKPRYGSGAAGVSAYRYHPKTYEAMLYTSLKLDEKGKLYNTKKIRKITDEVIIKVMMTQLLKQPVIIEKWLQKAQCDGLSYDLRVVYQYGQIDYMVARGSKNPITNLHLNNCLIPIEKLKFTPEQLKQLEDLCAQVVSCFKGLNIAGIDILRLPSGKFKVIEVNGQGDLIYQDLFNENRIYTRQIVEGIKQHGN